METQTNFLGTGWAFPPTFDEYSKSVAMVNNEEDIQESLHILLSTTPGERSLELDYGCDLSPLAFQTLDLSLTTLMINTIKTAIARYEPRIQVDNIQLAMEEAVEGVLNIHIRYTIQATNTKHNKVYPFYLEEGQIRTSNAL